jgi:hypothetical protein
MNEFTLILKEIASHYLEIKEKTEFNRTKNIMLVHLMDRCLRIASHMVAPDASELAFERAKKNDVDIFKLREKDRNKVELKIKKNDPKDNEKFILEHYIPVNIIIKEMLNDSKNNTSSFENALNKIKVIWVLKSEDERLNSNGHRKNRPDPKEAYRLANIKIKLNPNQDNWLL